MSGSETVRGNSRHNIMDAAQRVTAREGAGNLTLEKVAGECGISKGGLLYNFPSKVALLQAMLERDLAHHRQLMDRELERIGDQPNALLLAFLAARRKGTGIDPSVPMSILAAAAQKPELLAPVKTRFRELYEELCRQCPDKDQALLLWAAMDGLLFHTIFGTAPYSREEEEALMDRMLEMAGGMR